MYDSKTPLTTREFQCVWDSMYICEDRYLYESNSLQHIVVDFQLCRISKCARFPIMRISKFTDSHSCRFHRVSSLATSNRFPISYGFQLLLSLLFAWIPFLFANSISGGRVLFFFWACLVVHSYFHHATFSIVCAFFIFPPSSLCVCILLSWVHWQHRAITY